MNVLISEDLLLMKMNISQVEDRLMDISQEMEVEENEVKYS